mmetsp:Transcript_49537/g.111424  ORF Transcript_49537/g.111424 Transcript_49537/m.111424 type:complete len:220 (+) Transcript_49537:82-741(+)
MARAALSLLLASALLGPANALELTKETWEDGVAGKTVFVKFFATWCGHCKRMKPDWDKLMSEFKDSKTILVADVDCTGSGKSKCEEVGVKGYPAIKYGDPGDLQDYKGGRTFADLKKHAESLGPQCSPANLELCDADKRKMLEEFQALSSEERDKLIQEKDQEIEKLEAEFKEFVAGLNKQYQEAVTQKDNSVSDIKSGGLGILKSVHAFEKKSKSQEL